MVRRGLVASPEGARQAIRAGRILVVGAPATNAARLVATGEPIRVLGPPPRFVSRGGEKLEAALTRFTVMVTGRVLDAGASTGGFTDCLLQRGATEVVAIDVGHGQLHERLRADARVVNRERTNLRTLRAGDLGPPFALVVVDLSFISLRTVLAPLLHQAAPAADVVVLLKPQFEAARPEVSRGAGVISEPTVWRRVLDEVRQAATDAGAAIVDVMVSPLRGAEGNVEFLLHIVAPGADHAPRANPIADDALDDVVAEAVSMATRSGGQR